MALTKTRIEWCDYTINPVKGLCPVACDYCYARRMYKRFKWNPEIRFESDAVDVCLDLKAGSKVFIGSTFELFGEWVKPEWLKSILDVTRICPEITFIFLTKRPENLIKWSPFPDNCWVGVSVTNREQAHSAFGYLPLVSAKVKFLSFEPLLYDVSQYLYFPHLVNEVQLVICGQQTPIKKATTPKIEWIEEIVEACDKAKIPVFLKDNLRPLLPVIGNFYTSPFLGMDEIGERIMCRQLRQEFPNLKNILEVKP